MMHRLAKSLAFLATLMFTSVLHATSAPLFTLLDTGGKEHALADYRGKYVVLEWLNYDCPFVRKHYESGNMPRIQSELTGQGVVWLAVVSSAPGKQGHFPGPEMDARGASYGSEASAVLMDESGDVGRIYGARTTPQMFLINPEGELLYQGAIDDKPSTRQSDIPDAHNYLLAAWGAVMAGNPVSKPKTQPYGCSVKY